jgi:putative Mn2+ efflux pump MntP
MAKSFIENFGKWQLYMHYILLAIGISLVAKHYGAPIDWKMFWILTLALFIFDTIVHYLFWMLPKKYGRWRD